MFLFFFLINLSKYMVISSSWPEPSAATWCIWIHMRPTPVSTSSELYWAFRCENSCMDMPVVHPWNCGCSFRFFNSFSVLGYPKGVVLCSDPHQAYIITDCCCSLFQPYWISKYGDLYWIFIFNKEHVKFIQFVLTYLELSNCTLISEQDISW